MDEKEKVAKLESDLINLKNSVGKIENDINKKNDSDAQRDREFIDLKVSLNDFMETMKGVIAELKELTKQNRTMIENMNIRLKNVEDKLEELSVSFQERKKYLRWLYSILVPAFVALGVEFLNLWHG